jgi:hypothetical protein
MLNELKYGNKNFHCPHCKVMARQKWVISSERSKNIAEIYQQIFLDYRKNMSSYEQEYITNFLKNSEQNFYRIFSGIYPNSLSLSLCDSCNNFSIWVNKKLVYPKNIPIENPNSDMNQDIQDLYNEAASILFDSPKGAAALLRLALQKLLEQLGETGKINDCIGNLVKRGLSPKIQQALDVIRVVGNNAIHPGEINLDDNKDVAIKLFKIINIIANDMITHPKEIEEIYDSLLPSGAIEAIERRDN